MLVAEFGKDLKPPTEKLVVLEWNDVFDLFLILYNFAIAK